MSGTELVLQGEHGNALDYRKATDAAALCKSIVTATAMQIAGRKYVRVEGWQAIAIAHGCVASSGDVERIEGGVRAIGTIRRGSDGQVIAQAEGFVGDDEETWGKRQEYAKRAMAQTRAISRACRSAFAHVVVMMGAGLETTPAEEVPAGGFDSKPPVAMPTPRTSDTAQTTAGSVVTGLVEAVSEKTGERNGKPWHKYGVKVAGEFYGTFDTAAGEFAKQATAEGREVRVEWAQDGKYRNLLRIGDVSSEDGPRAATGGDDLPL